MWTDIAKKQDNLSEKKLQESKKKNQKKKHINKNEKIDFFELYHNVESIEFINNIKKELNNNSYNILDKEFDISNEFVNFLSESLTCNEEIEYYNIDDEIEEEIISDFDFKKI